MSHTLTWRGWFVFTVVAPTRKEAITKALTEKPPFIPSGTELHYGSVGSAESAVGRAS